MVDVHVEHWLVGIVLLQRAVRVAFTVFLPHFAVAGADVVGDDVAEDVVGVEHFG